MEPQNNQQPISISTPGSATKENPTISPSKKKPTPGKWFLYFILTFIIGFGSCAGVFGMCFHSSCGIIGNILSGVTYISYALALVFIIAFIVGLIRKLIQK